MLVRKQRSRVPSLLIAAFLSTPTRHRNITFLEAKDVNQSQPRRPPSITDTHKSPPVVVVPCTVDIRAVGIPVEKFLEKVVGKVKPSVDALPRTPIGGGRAST